MKILAYNPGHDGAVVLIEGSRLRYVLEAEKDDGRRFSPMSPTLFLRSLQHEEPPDVVAISGYLRRWFGSGPVEAPASPLARVEAGYLEEGPEGKTAEETLVYGRRVKRFSSSHVRSHIMCAYGLSSFPQGKPCYALIWEGALGALYHVDEEVRIRKIGDILSAPGSRYQLLYALADPTLAIQDEQWNRLEDAGKLMALAAYGRPGTPTDEQREVVERLLSLDVLASFNPPTPKSKLKDSRFFNIGVETQELKDAAWQLSVALFDRFYQFAKAHVSGRQPLIIAGGCGLNCDWNSQWRECGLFSDVFVPPCANDSGVALGAAIDALHHYTGRAKVEWDVYAGEDFIDDVAEAADFVRTPLSLAEVCVALLNGEVIAWAQGRYEMGPRALGNRSLLAAPFSTESRDKLNRIKQREPFRPIAPICLEEDMGLHFDPPLPSPHMLYFQRVKSPQLAAITHVDGSARAQSVNERDNPKMYNLLRKFREFSGFGVLCNTSLNFKGFGFINRTSQLLAYARDRGLDGAVVGTTLWRRRQRGG